MKPRTKIEHRAMELSELLAPITEEQKEWAFKSCLDHLGYANKSRGFCLDCGEDFPLDMINRKRVKCPSCGTSLRIKSTRKTTHKQECYFATAEVEEDFQVVRNFIVYAYHKRGGPVRHHVHEILQYWIDPNGKVTMVGRLHNLTGGDWWGGDWSIRKNNVRGYYYNPKYNIYPYRYWSGSLFKKEYVKYGIDHRLGGLTVPQAINIVPENPKAETLLKAGQYGLLYKCLSYAGDIEKNWPSIKICLRQRYKVKSVSDWFDYLDLLRYFGKDLHNAKYVCPKNLEKEHDRLVAKKRERQRKRESDQRRKRIAKDTGTYIERMQPFFGLVLQEKDITVKVLESVQEFIEEGDIHKHCLFTNEYYNRKDSLVMMAIVGDQRMETVEVSLSRLEVMQSRGSHNHPTEHHDRIVSLVERNMHKIESRLKSKRDLQKRAVTLKELLLT